MRRWLIVAVAALGVCAQAQAATPQPFDPHVAVSRAQQHFKVTPTCGGPHVVYEDSQLDGYAVGWADSADPSCTIHIAGRTAWYPIWTQFCAVVMHEYGHLLGLTHTSDPANVMTQGTHRDDRLAAPECFPRARRKTRHERALRTWDLAR